jgi:hypothetical protein
VATFSPPTVAAVASLPRPATLAPKSAARARTKRAMITQRIQARFFRLSRNTFSMNELLLREFRRNPAL